MGPLGARAGPGEWPPSIFLLNAALAVAGMGAGLLAAGLGRWGLRWLFVVDTLTCLFCALTVHHALLEQQLAVGRTVFVTPRTWRLTCGPSSSSGPGANSLFVDMAET